MKYLLLLFSFQSFANTTHISNDRPLMIFPGKENDKAITIHDSQGKAFLEIKPNGEILLDGEAIAKDKRIENWVREIKKTLDWRL